MCLLDGVVPSPDTARGFLQYFQEPQLIEQIRLRAKAAGELSFVPEKNEGLRGLGGVQGELARRMADPALATSATLNHDATIIESQKQEVKRHAQKGKGYQPVAVVWAEQRLVVADVFRDGIVPAGKDNLRLIQRVLLNLPGWATERRFRAASDCFVERC